MLYSSIVHGFLKTSTIFRPGFCRCLCKVLISFYQVSAINIIHLFARCLLSAMTTTNLKAVILLFVATFFMIMMYVSPNESPLFYSNTKLYTTDYDSRVTVRYPRNCFTSPMVSTHYVVIGLFFLAAAWLN